MRVRERRSGPNLCISMSISNFDVIWWLLSSHHNSSSCDLRGADLVGSAWIRLIHRIILFSLICTEMLMLDGIKTKKYFWNPKSTIGFKTIGQIYSTPFLTSIVKLLKSFLYYYLLVFHTPRWFVRLLTRCASGPRAWPGNVLSLIF